MYMVSRCYVYVYVCCCDQTGQLEKSGSLRSEGRGEGYGYSKVPR
jgi:hypothetical protein